MLYKEFQTSSREQISFEVALIDEGVQFYVDHKSISDGGSSISTYYFKDEESYNQADIIEKRVMDEVKYNGISPAGKFIIALNLIILISMLIIVIVTRISENK